MSFGTVDRGLLSSSLLDHGPLPVAIMFLVIADKDKYGVISLNPRLVAKLLRIPLEMAQAGWDVLTSPDPDSSNKEHEGRRLIPYEGGKWLVVSHEKYQHEHSLAKKRERDAEAQRRHRAREKEKPCEVCGAHGTVAVGGYVLCETHGPKERVAKGEVQMPPEEVA